MSTRHNLLIAGTFVLGVWAVGCDDDPVDADAGRDAAAPDAAAPDAALPDGALPDGALPDGALPDGALPDGALPDGAITDATTAAMFEVTLTTEAEVPLCEAAAAGAAGTASVQIDAANMQVQVMNLVFAGLSGEVIGAHIHHGAPGVAGPVVLDFGESPTSPINRTFTAADYPSPPPAGAPATFAALLGEMRAGRTYINIHTPACMPGEIRGQIE